MTDNSPQFQLRVFAKIISSPGGAAENEYANVSIVPPGLGLFLLFYPQLKLRAILNRRCATLKALPILSWRS